ncbi:MAG: arylsulfatase, partial [Verrucomicrobiia bacterium]
YKLPDDAAVDSFDMLPALLAASKKPIRPHLLTQSFRGEFQLRQHNWKYLAHMGSGGNDYTRGNMAKYALPETAPQATGQLFDLNEDPGETTNLFFAEPAKRKELQELLKRLTHENGGRSAPRNRIPLGLENIPRLAR